MQITDFFASSSDLFVETSEDHSIKFANQSCCSVLGYTTDELLGKKFLDFLHPDDLRQAFDSGFFSVNTQSASFDIRVKTSQGKSLPLKWEIVRSERSLFLHGKNLSLEKELQEELAKEKTKFFDLFAQFPAMAVITSGPEHIYQMANTFYLNLVGQRDIIGKKVRDVIPNYESKEFSVLDRVFKTGERHIAINTSIIADWQAQGDVSERFFNYIYEPILNKSNQVEGILGIGFDVTQANLNERKLRAAERMASLGQMAASVAHEINNPLTYAWISTEFLQEQLRKQEKLDEPKNVRAFELIERTLDGLERVRAIVDSLKVFSRVEEPDSDELNLMAVVVTAVEMSSIQLKHVATLKEEFSPLPVIRGNFGKLIQVFVNLLINASQAFGDADPFECLVTVRTKTAEDGRAVVEIEDNGCGISPENLVRVFEPFFTTKPVGVGTGLGLSVCQGIIQSAGGEIKILSRPSEGTLVRVSFPPA